MATLITTGVVNNRIYVPYIGHPDSTYMNLNFSWNLQMENVDSTLKLADMNDCKSADATYIRASISIIRAGPGLDYFEGQQ